MTPWSGRYEAGMSADGSTGTGNGGAIWTHAHTGQFVELGWKYLAIGAQGGSGNLASGGDYVTLVSPDGKDFTTVVEKLEGRCLRCAGQVTETETASFQLGGALASVTKAQVSRLALPNGI